MTRTTRRFGHMMGCENGPKYIVSDNKCSSSSRSFPLMEFIAQYRTKFDSCCTGVAFSLCLIAWLNLQPRVTLAEWLSLKLMLHRNSQSHETVQWPQHKSYCTYCIWTKTCLDKVHLVGDAQNTQFTPNKIWKPDLTHACLKYDFSYIGLSYHTIHPKHQIGRYRWWLEVL